jgi:hypothetical protein
VDGGALRVAIDRVRATLGRRWGGYFALVQPFFLPHLDSTDLHGPQSGAFFVNPGAGLGDNTGLLLRAG